MHDTPGPRESRLMLEDGTLFRGRVKAGDSRPAAATTACGEVVFNTAMTGYQEALTDPSYSGQILVMTTPHVGNYGVCPDDDESRRVQVAGFVTRHRTPAPSNHRATDSLGAWLDQAGVPMVDGIDTRALVRFLRSRGVMRGAITTDPSVSDQELLAIAKAAAPMAGQNLAAAASAERPDSHDETLGEWATLGNQPAPHAHAHAHGPLTVVALDCGAKTNIYRHLTERGCTIIPLAHDASEAEILAHDPDGFFLSNGPGDPAAVTETIAVIRSVLDARPDLPVFGICLGHQLLATALGATTYKLPFGHRGTNHPVRDETTGRVQITSQNHGFCVDEESLVAAGCLITHRHLNDGTVAGFAHAERPLFAVQHHPEASPGPHDAAGMFDHFVHIMSGGVLEPAV